MVTQTEVLYGDRISARGKLRLGCSAILMDEAREAVLLTLRSDNGQWCLPGGMVNPGESVTEACEREVHEETGLQVRVIRLIGVYSDPNQLIVYPDGNEACVIVLAFEVERISGDISISEETSQAKFFPVLEAINMKLFHNHAEQIRDSISAKLSAFIR